jgi:SAM-dependent methyltransferase
MTSADADHGCIQRHQEAYYNDGVDYRRGSPHLSHWHLYDRLVGLVRDCLQRISDEGLAPRVLEIGSGHGGYTEPVLAAGCEVTAVEMSRPSLRRLEARYSGNSQFRGVLDPNGSLEGVGREFSLVLAVSVLHHIPDYLSFIRTVSSRLAPGGWLVSLQDPMWYPTLSRGPHILDRAGYFAWRLTQGSARQALATRARRLRGVFDPNNPADMVEYHVVRDGVDEQAVLRCLENNFGSVKLIPYWSNQAKHVQKLGEQFRIVNTFGVVARGYAGPSAT